MPKSSSPPPVGGSSSAGQKILGPIRRYFITGLLVVVPIWGTYLILKTLFITMEGLLGNLMKSRDLYYIPGFGILLLVSLIFLTGLFTTNIFGKKLYQLWERLLRQVPLVRNVYSMVKSVVDTVSFQTGEKKNFTRVVVIEYPRKGLFTFAFVVGEKPSTIDRMTPKGENVLSVFVPTVPNPISGFIILVQERDAIAVTLSVEEAMKIVFSVGLYSPDLIIDPSYQSEMVEKG
ncbi:MAG: DUF502 domain-containing protein [Nitrospiria bacterium]